MRKAIGLGLSLVLMSTMGAAAERLKTTCPGGAELDPYEIWNDVRGTKDAEAFAHKKFDEFADGTKYATWLTCQGFNVSHWIGPLDTPYLEPGEQVISAYFGVRLYNRDPLWRPGYYMFRKVHSQDISIRINGANVVTSVKTGYTVK